LKNSLSAETFFAENSCSLSNMNGIVKDRNK